MLTLQNSDYSPLLTMSILQTNLPTDTWVKATWDEYIRAIEDPLYEKAKCYYYNGNLRIEMPPVGNDHASDQTIIIYTVHLFAAIKNIDLNGSAIVQEKGTRSRSSKLLLCDRVLGETINFP